MTIALLLIGFALMTVCFVAECIANNRDRKAHADTKAELEATKDNLVAKLEGAEFRYESACQDRQYLIRENEALRKKVDDAEARLHYIDGAFDPDFDKYYDAAKKVDKKLDQLDEVEEAVTELAADPRDAGAALKGPTKAE